MVSSAPDNMQNLTFKSSPITRPGLHLLIQSVRAGNLGSGNLNSSPNTEPTISFYLRTAMGRLGPIHSPWTLQNLRTVITIYRPIRDVTNTGNETIIRLVELVFCLIYIHLAGTPLGHSHQAGRLTGCRTDRQIDRRTEGQTRQTEDGRKYKYQ